MAQELIEEIKRKERCTGTKGDKPMDTGYPALISDIPPRKTDRNVEKPNHKPRPIPSPREAPRNGRKKGLQNSQRPNGEKGGWESRTNVHPSSVERAACAVSICCMKATLLQISIRVIVIIMLWCYMMGTAPAEGVTNPTAVVKETIDEVIRLVTDEELKKPEQLSRRRILLEEAIGHHFSFSEIAKRSLAANWKNHSQEERQEFVRLFRSLLSKTYAGNIENYSGEEVRYLKERRKNSYAEVQTKIISPKTEVSLDYRLFKKDGTWWVYDVVVNGVSLVKNYRSQFARIIRRSSYEDLVTILREKSGQIKAP